MTRSSYSYNTLRFHLITNASPMFWAGFFSGGGLIFLNGQSLWRMCGGHPQQQIVTVMEILHFWGTSFGGALVFLNSQNPSPMADMLKKESSWLGRQHYTSEWGFFGFFWGGLILLTNPSSSPDGECTVETTSGKPRVPVCVDTAGLRRFCPGFC